MPSEFPVSKQLFSITKLFKALTTFLPESTQKAWRAKNVILCPEPDRSMCGAGKGSPRPPAQGLQPRLGRIAWAGHKEKSEIDSRSRERASGYTMSPAEPLISHNTPDTEVGWSDRLPGAGLSGKFNSYIGTGG